MSGWLIAVSDQVTKVTPKAQNMAEGTGFEPALPVRTNLFSRLVLFVSFGVVPYRCVRQSRFFRLVLYRSVSLRSVAFKVKYEVNPGRWHRCTPVEATGAGHPYSAGTEISKLVLTRVRKGCYTFVPTQQ